MLAVSSDALTLAGPMVARLGLHFPVLSDLQARVIYQYRMLNPLTNQPDFPPGAPRVPPNIQQACQSIASRLPPQAQTSQPPTAASMQALLRFARCMRSHGVVGWPDPNTLGEFPMTQQMSAQFKGPADQSAVRMCIRYVPGGSQYLQFVGAGPRPAPGSGNG